MSTGKAAVFLGPGKPFEASQAVAGLGPRRPRRGYKRVVGGVMILRTLLVVR